MRCNGPTQNHAPTFISDRGGEISPSPSLPFASRPSSPFSPPFRFSSLFPFFNSYPFSPLFPFPPLNLSSPSALLFRVPCLFRPLSVSIFFPLLCLPLPLSVHVEVVAWLSGSALVSINVVTVRRARLVLGWVTVCGWVNYLRV